MKIVTKMSPGLVGLGLLTLTVATACGDTTRGYDGVYDEGAWDVTTPENFMGNVQEENLDLAGQSMDGRMGAFQAVDSDVTARGYYGNGYLELDLLSVTDEGAAMQAITVFSDADIFEPGFASRTTASAPNGDISMYESVICSGATPGAWDFDQQPTEVAIETRPTDDTNIVEVEVETVDYSGDAVVSTFLVDRTESLRSTN